MRIIAGQFRGRQLKALEGTTVRPTSDKLRETLFNILAPWIQDAAFIDCYAGTGAVGIEALSRGARRVELIEADLAALRVIERNLSWMASREAIHCHRGTVGRILPRLAASGLRADICFLDPPYAALQEALGVLERVVAGNLMNSAALIIMEHSKRDATPEVLGGAPGQWKRTRLLQQGDSALSFYRQEA
jgi:16S rRNA (guanine966-N2)-methyltransferase